MRARRIVLISACLLLAAGAWLLWLRGNGRDGALRRPHAAVAPAVRPYLQSASTVAQAAPFTILSTNNVQAAAAATARANQFRYRLSNTTKSIGELVGDRHAILLANALIDTGAKLNLSIPKQLQAPGEPGAYIVQANGPIDNAFRAMLAQSGAQIVSYIPNNAYLVTLTKSGANALAGNPMTQAVIPYEPYYKISSSMPVTIEQKASSWTPNQTRPAARTTLLALAVAQKPLPAGTYLTLGLFTGGATATVAQIEKLGGQIVARDNSPFGPVVRVRPPADWVALAGLPGVHVVEPAYRRASANDLSRATVGVAIDQQAATNYLGLTGKNVLVEVNDSGIDATHPDFGTGGGLPVRVIGDSALSLVDTNGHGTHVAGIIAGDGTESMTVTNAQGSIMPATNGQFRGMAPLATLYSVAAIDNTFSFLNSSDQYLQAAPALTNALISNNSWNYDGDNAYDLAAASYDAAVRDALPLVTGSQPVLFVFSAGNDGNGDDTTDPGNGTPDSIASPATAKNVITVGAIQEFRNITNEVTNADGTISAPWKNDTSTDYRIAGFSSRGNVGIGTEGTYGRYKPDVVAPGTSIISTRSSQWDIGTYFYASPTNYNVQDFSVIVQADSLGAGEFPVVPTNTVQVTIQLFSNGDSPDPFPTNLPIYFGLVSSSAYDYSTFNNQVSIPPDGGLTIPDILGSEAFYGFNYAVSNITSEPINFDIELDTITTNNPGNYFLVLSNLDNSLDGNTPPHYYRYETGTSMSAADVSGVLALMQDYFTNTLHATPSPALLKAMLINGAHPTGAYDLQVANNINFEGWGLINLPNSLPPGVTNQPNASCSSFFIDQNPTNALATGDSHTFMVTVSTNAQQASLPLRVTLAWTDPPGDPAAAIKLVNSLALVVTNLDDPANPVIYYGNDIGSGSIYNTQEGTNTPPIFDAINNVENVFISQPLGQNYSITVIGRDVNVNAVTAQTNTAAGVYAPNVVQDFALVVSCGEGEVTNAITAVTDNGIVSNPTADQLISFLSGTNVNAPLLNQIVGASSPLLGTNTVPIGAISVLGTNGLPVGTNSSFAANAIITLGQTNQWHFYVITNPVGGTADITNAAFVTFNPEDPNPDTLSIPRMGVFADSTANATRPKADIDMYVTTDSNLLTLSPVTISNCVHGTQVGQSAAGSFNGASLSRGGTEFVVDIGSKPGQVYYVGVYSEDQMAAEYGFLSVFTATPFSQINPNGNQQVNGIPLPVNIPDGSTAHPGIAYVFGLAIYPMEVGQVVVNDSIVHQNFGDLIGTLNHNDITSVLNNHDSLVGPPGPYNFQYDDSGSGNYPGSQPSDGPGSLQNFTGTQSIGPWMLTEEDTALTQTGSVTGFTLTIVPQQDLSHGVYVTVQPESWSTNILYVDVPVGYTNMTVSATNETPSPALPPLQLYVNLGAEPTFSNYVATVWLTNSGPLGPGNSISIGPPLTPGRYYVRIFNPSLSPQYVYIITTLSSSASAISTVDYDSSGPVPILDDAVTYDYINVTDTNIIQDFTVGLRVDHPRISDLVFHLISPDGTRYLLMENRGGTSTNGCGATVISSTNGVAATNYVYLTFTEDTNLTTTPIKFAPTPFVPGTSISNLFFSGFEGVSAGAYMTPSIVDGWNVLTTNPVTVVNDPAQANTGNNFLQVGNGSIGRTLPTIAGQSYTLSFAYRASMTNLAGLVSWWPGENNANDVIGGNNGTLQGGLGFAAGEVGQAFNFNNTNDDVRVPASSSLDVGAGNGFTLETWVNPSDVSSLHPLFEWNDDGTTWGVHFYIAGSPAPGSLYANIVSPISWHQISSSIAPLTTNVFQHVALTYDKTTGITTLYYNGTIVGQQTFADLPAPITTYNLYLGRRPLTFGQSYTLAGLLDEPAIFNRVLSQSEIQAIYNAGPEGKCGLPTPPAICPEIVQVALSGQTTNIFLATTNWQIASIPFTATQNDTPLTMTSAASIGLWLDTFTFTLTGAASNLYYLPEQDISAINGQSAYGTWTLEIQDDRAGATNNATLLGWQLGFTFANTNFTPTIGPGQPLTNVIPSGGIVYFAVPVPVNADIATNTLLFSTGPKNIWFDTNNPPTTNIFLFGGLNGSLTLSTTGSAPTNLVPGSTYYIVEQNTNSFTITNAFEVDFHLVPGILAPYAFTQPANAVTGAGAQLNGMATPNGLPATAWFQWGTSTAYGNQTPAVSVGTGSNVVYVANTISGLSPNVPYHFRLVVSNALAVTTGFDQILDEANVVVWGADYVGQANVPSGLSNVVAVAGAYDHSLALKNDETAVAWGDNAFGQATVPVGLGSLLALAGGEYYSMALINNGTVASWGANILAQTNVPAGLNNVVEIAGGTFSSLALKNDGTVAAWGANFFGLTNVPAGLSNVVAVAGGSYHSLAIKNDGTVMAWGDDSAGQTNLPAGLTNVVAIAGGSYHSVALKGDGTVVAWGDDSAGQTNVPAGLNNVVAVAAGGFHSLALKNDGTVVAWGDNSAGQTSVPVGLSNVVAIASGYFHSLALTPLFNVNSTNPIVLNATNGVAQTNSILPGGITYYQINVPANADFATNRLLFTLNGSLNVWFSSGPPTTNVFLFSGTNGSYTLSTAGGAPTNLVPGSTYYLGVQNTNSVTVTYGIEVDFHLLTNPPIVISGIIATNIGGTNGFLLTWFAPTNDEFLVHWTDSLTPPVAWGTFSNIVTYTSLTPTNGIGFFEFFDDGSQTPPGLPPMRFYRLELLQSPTNGVPQTNTLAAGGIDYFLINVPANADFATNLLLSATGPVNLLFNEAAPPTGTNAGDETLLAGVTSGSSILSTSSTPTNIVPGGTYWLGVQNTNSSNVTFSLEVNFHLLPAAGLSISSITFTTNSLGTNGFLLKWLAPTNDVFQVQWENALSPANWQFFTNFIYYTGPITPANGLFSFFDDGSQTPPGLPPTRFYRIVLVGSIPSTHTNAVSISSVTSTNLAGMNGFWFTWSAPTNYLFEMQWTTNLVPVITWQTFPDIIAYSTFVSPSNSLFNFLDNGSPGGLGPIKFYRLILLP